MAVNIEDILLTSLTQKGKRYVFGAEAAKTNSNPAAFDCSELVEWSCGRRALSPNMPDGAYNQWIHTKGLAIPVATGMRTRGALLFVGDGTGTARDAITHVAWSLGDGTTIEARGKAWGVGCWPSAGRFNFSAKVPGATYGPPKVPPVNQPSGRPVLRLGSKGAHVTYLQTVYRKRSIKGRDGKVIVADGSFGANTDYATRALQAYCRLKVDGAVGPSTWAIVDQLARA